ncbi:YciI family protein [Kibdelosporangium philippinense]|uniref:YciI family protein n=1 Tax=Kibdelosporangium philippinense TaxID=211113 RepID=A0ABS8Z0K3_9PSEU|nr:YciI family protein [Kibdelosporangium philippinense]MCE7001499.1 YciI family protein [Kibdelosporangium philippinense]
MKYLLIMNINPATMATLTEEEREAIGAGHQKFMDTITETGEMIVTQALADPSNTLTVQTKNGVQVVTDGPYIEAKEFMGGFYLVECESKERAVELAKMIPDTKHDGFGVEVRPVMFSHGLEM